MLKDVPVIVIARNQAFANMVPSVDGSAVPIKRVSPTKWLYQFCEIKVL